MVSGAEVRGTFCELLPLEARGDLLMNRYPRNVKNMLG